MAEPQDCKLSERWWELYHDPLLNSLEEQITGANLTIATAEARFRQARAAVQVAKAGYFPSLSTGASAAVSQKSGGGTNTTFQIPLEVSWELDLWGRVRRGVEASQANARASAADLAAVTLSSQAELANNYFQLRILDAQKQLLEKTITVYRKSFEMTNNRYAAGIVAKADVLQAETQLKNTEAQKIDLGVQRAQLEHSIALLIGKPPSVFSLPATELIPAVPLIPTGIPSEMLERRPDIASSERSVAAANAQIGIAKAANYPAIQLTASVGLQASSIASLLSWPSRFWSVGPTMSLPIFDGGLRKGQSDVVKAAYDATVSTYRETILTAFQEVEDNLAALRILEEETAVQNQAVRAAQQVVTITTNQYQAGTVAYVNVLVAQSTSLASERAVLGAFGAKNDRQCSVGQSVRWRMGTEGSKVDPSEQISRVFPSGRLFMNKQPVPSPYRHEHAPVKNVNEVVKEQLTFGQFKVDASHATLMDLFPNPHA